MGSLVGVLFITLLCALVVGITAYVIWGDKLTSE